jgi:hypothetical protein
MRPQPWTGLGTIVKEELGGVFCTLGYIILQDSLFLGDLANLIFQNQVLKCFPCSPDDGDYRPPILVKLFFEIYSFESVQWTRVMGEYPRVHNTPGFPIPIGLFLFCLPYY